jgi:4-hydroxy-3-polyprenylbenzoate decarboxylase
MKYYRDLRDFIKVLEEEDELVRIKTPVSRDLEISEIYFRQIRSPGGGKALLFENVEGSNLPVLINAFGSKKRMDLALGRRAW